VKRTLTSTDFPGVSVVAECCGESKGRARRRRCWRDGNIADGKIRRAVLEMVRVASVGVPPMGEVRESQRPGAESVGDPVGPRRPGDRDLEIGNNKRWCGLDLWHERSSCPRTRLAGGRISNHQIIERTAAYVVCRRTTEKRGLSGVAEANFTVKPLGLVSLIVTSTGGSANVYGRGIRNERQAGFEPLGPLQFR